MAGMERRDDHYDNVMEYWLFLPSSAPIDKGNSEDIIAQYLTILKDDLSKYMWQNDAINFTHPGPDASEHICSLYGRTDYGDNVEDLWFIVYLLKKLTSIVEGLVVKLTDPDGEFLLIEAADHLPKWLDPETSKNRVFLFDGKVHIVPIAQSPGLITPAPSGVPLLETAVNCVRANSKITEASPEIQHAIERRTGKYPEWAIRNIHSTTCYLPVNAAKLLMERPQLVSAAVRAFYLRDPLDLKTCRDTHTFSPDTRIKMRVRMTRCLYAQLMQQQFFPPKRSSWNIPPANHPEHKAYDLGMKLAFGLEILCLGAKAGQTRCTNREKSWRTFHESLKKNGYFQGEIEGSIKYTELLHQSQSFFTSCSQSQDDSPDSETPHEILSTIESSSITVEELRAAEKHLEPDDEDHWLFLTAEDLDDLLEEITGSKPTFKPESVANGMKAFMEKQSNILSGAKLPNDEKIAFDSQGFLASIEKMMNGEEGELDSDDDSSLDDYDTDESIEETEMAAGSTLKTPGNQKEPEIGDFMQLMDKELSKTNIAKSFERTKPPVKGPSNRDETTSKHTHSRAPLVEEEDLSDEEPPVDIDLNTVKNILESYSNQMGLPGPASNLLEGMGIQLPSNSDM